MDIAIEFFRWLANTHGINLSIIYDAYDRDRFIVGFGNTLKLAIFCVVLSVLIGLAGAWLLGSHSKIAKAFVQGYVAIFRNTPPLVQLYFFYFALGALLPKVADAHGAMVPPLSNTTWAILSLSLFGAAFNIEIFRSGIEAVPSSTVEATESLGYTRFQSYRLVVLPLALRICLPAFNNNLVNLVKTTTLAYAIGVPELMYASSQIWSETLNVRVMMNVLLLCYILLVAVLVWMMGRWERAMRIPGYTP